MAKTTTVKKETTKTKKATPKTKTKKVTSTKPRTKKAAPKTVKPKLKGTKTPKPKTKKKKVVENIEILELAVKDWKLEMFDTAPNCLWRQPMAGAPQTNTYTFKFGKRKGEKKESTFWSMKDTWHWTYGNVNYRVAEMRIFDENGVIYDTHSVFQTGSYYSVINSPYVRFKDVEKIQLKRKEDFKLDTPFTMHKRKEWYSSGWAEVVLYIPIRYLAEMGYKFTEKTEVDARCTNTYTKRLETRIFSFEVERKKCTDFEAQKKALLEKIKECKDQYEIARAIRDTTNINIRSNECYAE